MIVATENISPRTEYIFRYLLEDILGYSLRFSSTPEPGEAVIAYTIEKPAYPCIHIVPYGLLTEQGIRKQQAVMESWAGLPCFFCTEGDIPFDLFSASFYLVSRYEEYMDHQKDAYGRYDHRNSLAFAEGFLNLPLVELWAKKLKDKIRDLFPGEFFHFRTYHFVPSYDIDQAWCYKHKGFLRNAGGLVKEFLAGDLKKMKQRIAVLRGKEEDPYDVYEWLDALHLRYRIRPYYFFPLAVDNGVYDKNISPYNDGLKQLLSYHSEGYKTGIHPSWRSGEDEKAFREELALFAGITGADPVYSRFHYLRFILPDGYRKLISHGIREDHSMGYGTINGFRASVSTAFWWYDLEKEEQTTLKVQPWCWMDANSYYEQKYTPAQAYDELQHYHDQVHSVNGTLVTISHNNFLSNEPGFAGWKQVYEIFLDEVVYWDL